MFTRVYVCISELVPVHSIVPNYPIHSHHHPFHTYAIYMYKCQPHVGNNYSGLNRSFDRFCGLVVRVPGY
jgi:hypothetical protein